MKPERKKPNIIIILPDQLRQDACSCYNKTALSTESIDKIAESGLMISNAISTCPLCTPYRGMMMTGRYPTHSGIVNNFVASSYEQNPLPLATCLAEVGYDTAYFGKWHLGAGSYGGNLDNPEFIPPGVARMGFNYWRAYNFHLDFNNYWYYGDEKIKISENGFETDIVFHQALEYLLDNKRKSNPFFMVLAPHPPHPPYGIEDVPQEYREKVPTSRITWLKNVPDNNPRSIEEMRTYLAMVQNLDKNVSNLVECLDELKIRENTLLIFTSDHGEMHGSHGLINKLVPYSEAIDVPLIFNWPGQIESGFNSELLFGPMDFLPTLCSIAGAEVPDYIDGMDLSPFLFTEKKPPKRNLLLATYSSHWNYFRSDTPETAEDWRCWPEWRGVRNDKYTFVRWINGNEECYDNTHDPYQQQNLVLSAENDDIIFEMRILLDKLLKEAHDKFLPGDAYANWYNDSRQLIRTGLGPVDF